MAALVLNTTKLGLTMTGFFLCMTEFFLNMTGHDDDDDDDDESNGLAIMEVGTVSCF